jgi:putative flippase GtrA
VAVVEAVLARIPEPYRSVVFRHRELLKFAMVGGTTWVIDNAVNYSLKLTVLGAKPITARIIAVLIATIVSYVLNREWSFRTRGGRERHHEAALFFLISGIAMALTVAPLGISIYVLKLHQPYESLLVGEIADFVSGQIVGVLVAMAFRYWAFKRWVFPTKDARQRVPIGSIDIGPVNGTRINGKRPAEEEFDHS